MCDIDDEKDDEDDETMDMSKGDSMQATGDGSNGGVAYMYMYMT